MARSESGWRDFIPRAALARFILRPMRPRLCMRCRFAIGSTRFFSWRRPARRGGIRDRLCTQRLLGFNLRVVSLSGVGMSAGRNHYAGDPSGTHFPTSKPRFRRSLFGPECGNLTQSSQHLSRYSPNAHPQLALKIRLNFRRMVKVQSPDFYSCLASNLV